MKALREDSVVSATSRQTLPSAASEPYPRLAVIARAVMHAEAMRIVRDLTQGRAS